MNEDQNEVEAPSALLDASGSPLTPAPTIDDKLAEVRRKLGLREDAVREALSDEEEEQQEQQNGAPSGADVDWTDYDLDPKFAHLYRLPSTKLRMGPDGPVWVAIIDDFLALRAPYAIIGRQIAQLVNGPEGWRLQSAVVPAGVISKKQALLIGGRDYPSGPCGVVTLQRKAPVFLPIPAMLKSEQADAATVPAPKEEELQVVEDAALAWIESDAGKAAPVNDGDTPVVTPPSLEERAEEPRNPHDTIAEGARRIAAEVDRLVPPLG